MRARRITLPRMSAPAILSPHPDDAVLSLWHVLAAPGGVSVLNVFNGPPDDDRRRAGGIA